MPCQFQKQKNNNNKKTKKNVFKRQDIKKKVFHFPNHT